MKRHVRGIPLTITPPPEKHRPRCECFMVKPIVLSEACLGSLQNKKIKNNNKNNKNEKQ